MFVDDSAASRKDLEDHLHRSLTEHLTALVSCLFMGSKPAKPSQSRWTGMANCAQWALCLAMWHQLLNPLFTALASGQTTDVSENATTMDADVRSSAQMAMCGGMSQAKAKYCRLSTVSKYLHRIFLGSLIGHGF